MISKAIRKYRDYTNKSDVLIRFEELKEIPVGKTIDIVPESKGAIELERVNTKNNSLRFWVSMKKGEIWREHYHDCAEYIVVYKGLLKDLKNGRIFNRMENLKIKKGVKHNVIAEEDTTFYVEFKSPEAI